MDLFFVIIYGGDTMKFKTARPWAVFWKNVINELVLKDRDATGFIISLIFLDDIMNNPDIISLSKEFGKGRSRELSFITAINVAINAYITSQSFAGFEKLLELLYVKISSYPFDDVKIEDMTDADYRNLGFDSKVTNFLLYNALRNQRWDDIGYVLNESRKKETNIDKENVVYDAPITYPILTLLTIIKNEDPNMQYLNDPKDHLSEEQLADLFGTKIIDDSLTIHKDVLQRIIKYLSDNMVSSRSNFDKLLKMESYCEKQQNMYKSLESTAAAFIKTINTFQRKIEELESIINKTEERQEKPKEEIYIPFLKLQNEYDDLKRENAENIKEIEFLNEIIEKMKVSEPEPKEEIMPFDKPVNILYFGLENPQLAGILSGYNVKINFFSPTEPPKKIPRGLAFFNVDIANHSVYYKIKSLNPILLSGSNAKILSAKILAKIKGGGK